MRTVFNGVKIDTKVKKENLRAKLQKYLGIEVHTNSLVQYDAKKNVVTIDERADANYAKYAVIHECICCGKYGKLAPETDDPHTRCGQIDMMLMSKMPTDLAKKYRKERVEMFKTLLNNNLYGNEDLKQSFQYSLALLSENESEEDTEEA